MGPDEGGAVEKETGGRLIAIEATKLLIVAIFLWHGLPKVLDPTTASERFMAWGLPGLLGPITGWVEVLVAPLLYVRATRRIAAAVLAAIIVGALVAVQVPGGITAGLERDLLILAALGFLGFSGAGFALGKASVPGSP